MDIENVDSRLLELLVRFATTMVQDYRAEDALDRLMADVPAMMGVDGAGVMLEDDTGELRFVSASNDTVKLIEEFQVETGQGPCVMAYETGEVVVADDLEAETPFPAFCEVALAVGMAAVHSFPMTIEGVRVGALNLYRSTAGALPDSGIMRGQLFADIATTYLFSARRHDRLTRQVEGMRNALQENGRVDQAKGVLMHGYGLQDREAFGVLRRYARMRRLRVLDVSTELMDGVLDPSDVVGDMPRTDVAPA